MKFVGIYLILKNEKQNEKTQKYFITRVLTLMAIMDSWVITNKVILRYTFAYLN